MQRAAHEHEREFLGQVAPFTCQLLLERHGSILALDTTLPQLAPFGTRVKSPDQGAWRGSTLMLV